MREFQYVQPADASTALATLVATPDAKYLGGGTNLVDLMKLGVETPAALVDVTRLPYQFVDDGPDGSLRIGATARNSDLAADARVRTRFPLLSQAILAGASGQLRNMATIGGNLLQRTRCVYFQDITKPCNKRSPGSGCPARDGDHRNLAILGASAACIATNPSDMAVALMALDATVHVQEPNGPREIPISEFYRLPGDDPDRETTMAPGGLITAVDVPALSAGANSRYRKVRDRASFSFALGSVAAALSVADGTVADVRIALGAVAHRPWRATRAEELVRGRPPTEQSFAIAADAELEQAEPLPKNAFKVKLMRNLIVRTLSELAP